MIMKKTKVMVDIAIYPKRTRIDEFLRKQSIGE